MPVCNGCGGSYDDKFNFCPNCGRAKPEPESLKVQVQVNISTQDKWETSKIYMTNWDDGSGSYTTNQLWCEAIGSSGKYLAGESASFRYYQSNTRFQKKGYIGGEPAHAFLVNRLVRDGWEAIPSGGEWWQTQFRRRENENNPKSWTLWLVNPKISGFKKHCFNIARIQGTKKIQGKNYPDWEFHGSSREFKGGLLNIGYSDEMSRILEEFVKQIISEGFEPVTQKENEELKNCLMEDTSGLWFYRAFLKRI